MIAHGGSGRNEESPHAGDRRRPARRARVRRGTGIDGILTARQGPGGDVTFGAFDLLQLDGQDVIPEPWTDRRKRLEDLVAGGLDEPRVQLVPAFEDARRLWTVWVVQWGGERLCSRIGGRAIGPGARSRSWWKVKHKLVLPVEVLHCGDALIPWGDWGRACVMAFAYRDPRTGEQVTVEQAVRVGVGRSSGWTAQRGPAEMLCWGLLRSGLLRHPLFVAYRSA